MFVLTRCIHFLRLSLYLKDTVCKYFLQTIESISSFNLNCISEVLEDANVKGLPFWGRKKKEVLDNHFERIHLFLTFNTRNNANPLLEIDLIMKTEIDKCHMFYINQLINIHHKKFGC